MNQIIKDLIQKKVWDKVTEISENEYKGHINCLLADEYYPWLTLGIMINNEKRYFKFKANDGPETRLLHQAIEKNFYGDKIKST